MIRNSVWLTVALAAFAVAGARRASAFEGRDAQCRYKVSASARNYADNLLQRMATCHQLRMKGKVLVTIDCNDPSTWAANGYGRAAHLMETTTRQMTRIANTCRPLGGTPASVGFNVCPAPCGAVPMATFDDVASCMRCLGDHCAATASAAVNGTIPLPALHPERRCAQLLGRKLHSYTIKRQFLESSCQYNQESGKPAFQGLDCTDLDNPANTMHFIQRRALNDLTTLITNQCSPIDMVSELDSCGSDAPSAIACLLAQATQCADTLFNAAFP